MGTSLSESFDGHRRNVLATALLDRDFNIVDVSSASAAVAGYTRDELLSTNALDLVHPGDLERAALVLADIQTNTSPRAAGLYRVRLTSGDYRLYGVRLRLGPEAPDRLVMEITEPTTELKATELAEDLVRAVRVFSADFSVGSAMRSITHMAERQLPGIVISLTHFSCGGRPTTWASGPLPPAVQAANEAAHPLSLPVAVAEAVRLFDRKNWLLHSRVAYRDPEQPQRIVFAMLDDDDNLMGYIQIFNPKPDDPGDSEWLLFGSIVQISQAALSRHRLNEALRLAAAHDPLTDLLDRRGLFDALRSLCRHCNAGLMVIDLDNFSWVNNELGHAAGDTALIAVAERLRGLCPESALVARMGGDEFIVVLTDMGDEHEIVTLADHIRRELVMPLGTGDRRGMVRASIGVCIVDEEESFEQAIRRADVAMYDAKQQGGDRISMRTQSVLRE